MALSVLRGKRMTAWLSRVSLRLATERRGYAGCRGRERVFGRLNVGLVRMRLAAAFLTAPLVTVFLALRAFATAAKSAD